jgi:hypothetical protein
VEAIDLNDLLKQSDFVSLHVPARPETEGMIDLQKLALMKPSAFIINTARGSVVDEGDLLEALNKGLISGAGLDVFAQEPAINSQLAQHERVIATPHIAASTEDAQMDAAITVVRQIIDILKGARAQVKNPLGLEVVALDRVLPHEHVDPRRVNRLVNRLKQDGIMANPAVVVELDDHYVVLDGASRVAALRELGYPHILVQIVSPQGGLSLHTWYHAIRKVDLATFLDRLNDLKEISLVETSPGKVLDEMLEYGGLCYLHTIDGRVFLVHATAGVNHLQALNMITETYLKAGHVSRTLHTDPEILQQEFPDLTALVVFPEYTVEQVLQIARAGRVLPAGITRFIVPGRALRVNVKLARLTDDESLSEKNRWLYDDIVQKFSESQVRYYQEPVYLLDE